MTLLSIDVLFFGILSIFLYLGLVFSVSDCYNMQVVNFYWS